jgi:hypothetical protein
MDVSRHKSIDTLRLRPRCRDIARPCWKRAAPKTTENGHKLHAVRRIGPVRYLRTIGDEVIASQLIWNCLTAKSTRYANEGEVRRHTTNS